MKRKTEIISDLINRAKREIHPFTSSLGLHHSFVFNRVILDSEISNLEDSYNIKIPEDYSEFLKFIGNGGEQPLSGMFSLEKSLAIYSLDNRKALPYLSDNVFADYWYLEIDESIENVHGKPIIKDSQYCTESYTGRNLFDDFQYNNHLKEECYNLCKHSLVFSYLPETNLQCLVVLDGKYQDYVFYYSSRSSKLINTHMRFLDWWIGYFKHILCNRPVYEFISMDISFDNG